MNRASLYKAMVNMFAGKSVSFSSQNGGLYRTGTVLEVYEQDPNILIILDEDGAEIEIDFSVTNVIIQ